MKIADILSRKATTGVETITSNDTVAHAAGRLSALRIGSLVVSDDNGQTLVGILSERDIVRQLGQEGADCLKTAVSALMTSDVLTVSPETTAEEALQTMTDGRFRHLPVMQDGALVGLISIGDVVAARLKQIERENSALNDMISGAAF